MTIVVNELKDEKKSPAKRVVVGVDMSRVKAKHLFAVAKEMGLPDARLPQTVELVATHFAKTAGKDLMVCDVCGGGSPSGLPACPFCNDGKEPETPKRSAAERTLPLDGITPNGTEAPGQLEEVARIFGAPAPMVVAPTAAIDCSDLRTEAELDAAMGRIGAMWVDHAGKFWEIGAELARVDKEQLWKMRETEGGGPRHRSFTDFLRVELTESLGISERWARHAMSAAKSYTREQIREFGLTKALVALQAPKEHRPRVLEEGKTKPVREVRRQVQRLNANAKPPKEKPKKPVAVERPNEITLATMIGKKHMVYLTPIHGARRHHGRHGCLDLENGVRFYFVVYKGKPDELHVTAERQEP